MDHPTAMMVTLIAGAFVTICVKLVCDTAQEITRTVIDYLYSIWEEIQEEEEKEKK